MGTSNAYLLDTNILVHLIRGKAAGQGVEANFGLRGSLNRCLISVVTVGEMYSLARQWSWGEKQIGQLQRLLGQLVWLDINHPEVLAAYGELDDLCVRAGCPLGKNDVWIAATAKVSGCTLLTTDSDFDYLNPSHLTRIPRG